MQELKVQYNANMAPNLIYVPTKFGWDLFIIKEF